MEHMEIRQLLNWLWKREPGDEEPIVVEDSSEPILTEIKKPDLAPVMAPVSKFVENKELAAANLATEKRIRLEEERLAKIELEKLEAEKALKEKLEAEKLIVKDVEVSKPKIEELPVMEVKVPEPPVVVVEKPKVILPKNRNFGNGMTCTRNLR